MHTVIIARRHLHCMCGKSTQDLKSIPVFHVLYIPYQSQRFAPNSVIIVWGKPTNRVLYSDRWGGPLIGAVKIVLWGGELGTNWLYSDLYWVAKALIFLFLTNVLLEARTYREGTVLHRRFLAYAHL